jgi:hypothetical protein
MPAVLKQFGLGGRMHSLRFLYHFYNLHCGKNGLSRSLLEKGGVA